jgi:hypothetical protein
MEDLFQTQIIGQRNWPTIALHGVITDKPMVPYFPLKPTRAKLA